MLLQLHKFRYKCTFCVQLHVKKSPANKLKHDSSTLLAQCLRPAPRLFIIAVVTTIHNRPTVFDRGSANAFSLYLDSCFKAE